MDRESVHSLLAGETSLFTRRHLAAWVPVILSWGSFYIAFFSLILSLNVLLRRRWIEEERLAFPIVQVPLAMTEPSGAIFRSGLLWIGFGLAFALGMVKGLHSLFPWFPSLLPDFGGLNADLDRQGSPLASVFWPPFPWAVGLAMFMPLDVSFSFWSFFWLVKIEQLATKATGWTVSPDAPFVNHQSAAALFAVGVYVLWSARKHLWRVVGGAIRPGNDLGDRDEPLPYRVSIAILIASAAFIGVFLLQAGMPLGLIPIFIFMHTCACIAVSRITAEVGSPALEIGGVGAPHRILPQIVSPTSFTARSLTSLVLVGWATVDYGTDPTSHQMGGFKLAERTGLRTRGLVKVMCVAAFAGLVYGCLALLVPLYRLGMESTKVNMSFFGQGGFRELETYLTGLAPPPGYRRLAMGFGFLFTFFLYAMRSRFLWWPFHPVGYLLAPLWFTHRLWLSVFIAWLAKTLLLRYGGLRAFSAARPLFIGLILGDCVSGAIWTLSNLVFGAPTYDVWM